MERGRGTPQDYQSAAGIYRNLCEDDIGAACARLADLHDRGAGVYRDPELAGRLRKKACNVGHAPACAGPEPAKPETAS